MKSYRLDALAVASSLFLAWSGGDAQAYGFFDQGFTQNPVVRTDYFSQTAGTASSPLQISSCHFGQVPCPTVRSVYPQSNYWTQNWPANCVPGFTCPTHNWILLMNNEPREATGNLGPPDASLPRFWPGGGGIMGFSTLFGNDNFPGDTYWRAHLVLSTWPTNPVNGAIPYLAFGAFANHGNGGPIGALNPTGSAPSILKFDARLWGSQLPQSANGTQLQTITSWVQVIASWGTYPKMIQIALWHQARDPLNPSNPDPYLGGLPPQNAKIKFDWRYIQSGLYPGFEYITLTAEEISSYCGFSIPTLVQGVDVHYSINLNQLFQCMKNHNLFVEPLPTTTNLPINTVLWANEATGINGSLWTDVHAMRMDTTAGISGDFGEEETGAPGDSSSGGQYGTETELIRQALENEASLGAAQQ
jgi:hypothetical protein